MKQKLVTALSGIILTLISLGALAQETKKINCKFPRWVSDKGYWVVETNLNFPLKHLVSFYTNDNILLFKKTLTGVRLDPDKRKVKMKLKKELEAVVTAWEKNHKRGTVNDKELASLISVPQ